MKKILFVLGVAVIAAVACEKSIEPGSDIQYNPDGSYTMTIRANASDMTKTAYAGDVTFSWSAGDEISVLFHDGDGNNVFKTFTTASGGTTATFTGTVEGGLTIGAYDDVLAANDGVKWALYPADSGHTFTKGAENPVSFNVPSETDFSSRSSYEIAPIPMWAQGDGSNNFSFKHLSKCYKFTFTNMDVSKVKMTITHTYDGYYLSGTSPIKGSGSDLYLEYYSGSGTTTVSQTVSVNPSTKTATFYIPCRQWVKLQPDITLYNMDAGANYGNILVQTTGKRFTDDTGCGTIVEVPSRKTTGVGKPFFSRYGIDWDNVSASVSGSADPDGIKCIKASANSGQLFLYFEIKTASLYNNASYSHANKMRFYFADGTAGTSTPWTQDYKISNSENWMQINGVTTFDEWDGLVDTKQIVIKESGSTYIELALNRSFDAVLQGTSVYVAADISNQYVESGSWKGSSSTKVGIAPAAGESMLAVSMPAYVAP